MTTPDGKHHYRVYSVQDSDDEILELVEDES